MKDLKEELKDNEIQLLRTGMSDNANLLNEDELGEIVEEAARMKGNYFIPMTVHVRQRSYAYMKY